MAIWPETLPQKPKQDNYQENPPNLVIRTQMDAGPAKVRRRYTAGVRPFTWVQDFTEAQLAILDAFYLTNCALAFTFPHPRAESNISARFIEPPSYRPGSGVYYMVEMKLEAMP